MDVFFYSEKVTLVVFFSISGLKCSILNNDLSHMLLYNGQIALLTYVRIAGVTIFHNKAL